MPALDDQMNGYVRQAKLMRALAHPTRLRILEILAADGECCVCHLVTMLGQRQPRVSQQLRVLRDSGLVADRQDGPMVYYRVADDGVRVLLMRSRQVILARDATAAFPPVPPPPIAGCPCPHCAAEEP
jgi:ArsR family transcriptional regulator